MSEVVYPFKLPVVTSLPQASMYTNRMVVYNNTVYFSTGSTWIDLGSGEGGGFDPQVLYQLFGFSSVFGGVDGILKQSTGLARFNWEGKVVGAFGNGDPTLLLTLMQCAGVVSPTPTNITTSVARVCFFRLNQDITVNTVRFYGVGTTTNIYRCAIYRVSDNARVTNELVFSTSANSWGSIAISGGVTLTANTLYFMAVAVNTTGTTAGVLAFGPTVGATTGQIQTLPTAFPGNLSVNNGYIHGGFAQFSVTSGALPTTAPSLSVQGAWTGGMPAFFLDSI